DVKFGVGLMDIVELASIGQAYRFVPKDSRLLVPVSVNDDEKFKKLLKITSKVIIKGSKVQYGFHDGKTVISDQKMRVGDTCVVQLQESQPMKKIGVGKVVINIGVGKSGEPLEKAKRALQELTSRRPSVRGAKNSVRDFNIHKGEPIGAMITLRREPSVTFLRSVLASTRNILKASSFDSNGNISIGIHEHIDI